MNCPICKTEAEKIGIHDHECPNCFHNFSTFLKGEWTEELETKGWENMLKDRLAFHGRLKLEEVAHFTDTSVPTVRKHFRRLVAKGVAQWGPNLLGSETILTRKS